MCQHVEVTLIISAVTVSIFGFAVGFGRFFDKNRGSGSISALWLWYHILGEI